MLIIILFDHLVWTCSSSVSSQDFYCSLPRDQSRDMTPRLEVFVILQCASFDECIFIPAIIISAM